MRTPRLSIAFLSLVLAAAPSCAAQTAPAADPPERQAPTPFDPDLHMRTDDVRIGMTGYGLSVFKGTQIERFDVEVLAILRNSEQIDTDVVLIRASGADLEKTGPISGMSGSPIYIHCDDGRERLLGAFAFGWPGSKEPIAGVQPIEAMLRLDPAPRPRQVARATGEPVEWDLHSARAVVKLLDEPPTSLAELLAGPRPSAPAAGNGRLTPLSIPLGAGGFTPGALQQLSSALSPAGIGPAVPLQVLGGEAQQGEAAQVAPGSALIVPILTGDLNLVATGTCTTVIGDRVFGFGHPMFGEGPSNLPFAGGEVNAVIPTTEISFKLGSPGPIVGTLGTDAVAGVAGVIGPTPPMIPVQLTVRRGEESTTFRFQAARHDTLTITALAAAAQNAVDLGGTPDPNGATRWDATIRYGGGRTLHLRDIVANEAPNPFFTGGFVGSLIMPLQSIRDNPFEPVEMESLEATVDLLAPDDVPIATLTEISIPRRRYRAGETVAVELIMNLRRGERVRRTVELQLPEDLEPGEYPLRILDSVAAIQAAVQHRPHEFDVDSVDDLFAALNATQHFSSDAVYLSLARPQDPRVAVGRQALPDLPRSRAVLLAESGRSDVATFEPALTLKVDLPYVLAAGEAEAVITVVRP